MVASRGQGSSRWNKQACVTLPVPECRTELAECLVLWLNHISDVFENSCHLVAFSQARARIVEFVTGNDRCH